MIEHSEQRPVSTEPITNALDIIATSVTLGVLAGFITWTAAIATAVWAVFRALNEYHKWRTRNNPDNE